MCSINRFRISQRHTLDLNLADDLFCEHITKSIHAEHNIIFMSTYIFFHIRAQKYTEISLFNFSNLQVNVFFFFFNIVVFTSQHFILRSLEMDALGNLLSKHNNTIQNSRGFFLSIINVISHAYIDDELSSFAIFNLNKYQFDSYSNENTYMM